MGSYIASSFENWEPFYSFKHSGIQIILFACDTLGAFLIFEGIE